MSTGTTDFKDDPLSGPRSMEHALADLIKRRETGALLPVEHALLDRMIGELKAEIVLRWEARSTRARR